MRIRLIDMIVISCLLFAIFGCKQKNANYYQHISDKAAKLSIECLIYSENHNGDYPEKLDWLIDSKQLDRKTLKELGRISDADGKSKKRHWIYDSKGERFIIYASSPLEYTQTLEGRNTTMDVWVTADRKGGVHLLRWSELPENIKAQLEREAERE